MSKQIEVADLILAETRKCGACDNTFPIIRTRIGSTVKKMFCSTNCKARAQYKNRKKQKPEAFLAQRKRSWDAIKTNPERLVKKQAQDMKARGKAYQWLAEYKLARGCVDCGYKEYAAALQLDHEGFKSVPISEARSSIARLQAEIEAGQCVVRCANCHSVITWKRKVGLA